jgi:hypothetical protein
VGPRTAHHRDAGPAALVGGVLSADLTPAQTELLGVLLG